MDQGRLQVIRDIEKRLAGWLRSFPIDYPVPERSVEFLVTDACVLLEQLVRLMPLEDALMDQGFDWDKVREGYRLEFCEFYGIDPEDKERPLGGPEELTGPADMVDVDDPDLEFPLDPDDGHW